MAKRRPQKLTKAEVHILSEFAAAIADNIGQKVGGDAVVDAEILRQNLEDRFDRFDYDGNEPQLWAQELDIFAEDMVDHILARVRAHLQERMGEIAWSNIGKPF